MFSVEFIKDEGIFKKGDVKTVDGYTATGLINKGFAKIKSEESEVKEPQKVKKGKK